MTGSWVDVAKVSSRLKDEAMSAATRLGHRMAAWVEVPAEERLFLARCLICKDLAQVSVRNPHRAPISGPAVELRCPPQVKPVADPAGGVPPRAR